jgi:hypothetical protein
MHGETTGAFNASSPSPLGGERAGVRGAGVFFPQLNLLMGAPLILNPSPLRGEKEESHSDRF